MRSDAKKVFYFRADANSLGGFIEKPFPSVIPSPASVSLPPVGGHLAARSGAFTHGEVVSIAASYTRVSGRRNHAGGWSVLVTSVVEGVNILEILTATRVVAQISADYPREGGHPRISLAGSRFEGLRIAGFEAKPFMSPELLRPSFENRDNSQAQLAWPDFLQTGGQQAEKLVAALKGPDREAFKWIEERYGWMQPSRGSKEEPWALCALVDGVDQALPGRSFRQVIEIPDYGKIFLGELIASPTGVQLTMIRAELGCGTSGATTVGSGSAGGHTVPP